MAEVLVVERLGDATYLYVRAPGGDTLIVQTNGDRQVAIRDQVPIRIDGNTCHLFDTNDIAIPKAQKHHLIEQNPEQNPPQPSLEKSQETSHDQQPSAIPQSKIV